MSRGAVREAELRAVMGPSTSQGRAGRLCIQASPVTADELADVGPAERHHPSIRVGRVKSGICWGHENLVGHGEDSLKHNSLFVRLEYRRIHSRLSRGNL